MTVSTTEVTYVYTPIKGQPRPAWTYRAARRNEFRGSVWPGVKMNYFGKPPVRENKRDRTND
jgi:hypothetical protein